MKKLLIVPDTHAPYHDKRAWNLMLHAAHVFKPDTIVHMGDLADFYAISSYSKNPDRISDLASEVAVCNERLDDLDALDATRKEFIEGNHEDRLTRYLQDKAPELYGLTSVPELFSLADRGWHFTPYRHHTKIGKVHFTHDTGQAGKYGTARAAETFQSSVVIGHLHQLQYQVTGDATGEYSVGAQFGWLGDVEQVDYMHRIKALRNWALGYGIGYHNTQTGIVYLQPVPIVNYRCCVEGVEYRG